MRLPAFCLCLLLALTSQITRAAEPDPEEIPEPFRTFIPQAQRRFTEFPEIAMSTKRGAVPIQTVHLDLFLDVGDARFACVRFTAPTEKGLDMVWAFSLPKGWRTWYILPKEGTMQGFQNWLDADRLYQGLPAAPSNPAVLQTLPADRLQPGGSYLLWFQRQDPKAELPDLHAAIGFFAPPGQDRWDADKIEGVLGLTAAPAAQQADYLESRGLHAVLDPRFFKPDEGAGYVNNVLTARRRLRRFADGRFVALKMEMPPCTSQPRLADVQAAYGAPDLVLSPEEQKVFDADAAAKSPIYYYDYLGFVTGLDRQGAERIVNVAAQGASAASLRSKQDGYTWTESELPEIPLRVFYHDKKEIARIAHWGEGNAKLLSGELPKEKFSTTAPDGAREELTYLGDGKWELRDFYADGKLGRTGTLVNHAFEDDLKDFYPDGKPRAVVPYKHGEIDGTFRLWNEQGQTQERKYHAGIPVK